jgi:hypothetical protein
MWRGRTLPAVLSSQLLNGESSFPNYRISNNCHPERNEATQPNEVEGPLAFGTNHKL